MDLKYYYHKYNYWVKQFLAVMIIIFTFLLISNPTILILKLWIVSFVPFILLQIAGLSGQLSIWRIALTLKKTDERDLDDILLQLAQDMGSSISTYFLGKDLSTAFLLRARLDENCRNLSDPLTKKGYKVEIAPEKISILEGNKSVTDARARQVPLLGLEDLGFTCSFPSPWSRAREYRSLQ